MKTRKKLVYIILSLFMVLCLTTQSSKVFASGSYTVGIGQTCTLYLTGNRSIVPGSVTWRSSDSRVIKIQSSTTSTCTVYGVSSDYGTAVTISCSYAYLIGGTSIRTSETFSVSLKSSSSSSSSGSSTMTGNEMYKLVPNYKSFTLDPSGNCQKVVHISAPNFNYAATTRDFQMNAIYDGNHVSVYRKPGWYNSGMDFTFTAKSGAAGTETVRIELTRDGYQVSYTDIEVNVTCGHQWTLTKTTAATVFSPAIKTYKCKYCSKSKTEQVGKKLTPTIRLSAVKLNLKVGKSYTIKVSGLARGDKVASWKSSNKKKVVVNNKGKVKAVKRGKAVVTVTLKSGKKKNVTVTAR